MTTGLDDYNTFPPGRQAQATEAIAFISLAGGQ